MDKFQENDLEFVEVDNYYFWYIMDRLREECTPEFGFYHNRALLVDAFAKKELYGVRFTGEGVVGYDHGLPCFIWVDAETDDVPIIWVGEELRRKGLATFMIQEGCVKCTPANIVSKDGKAFFSKMEENGLLAPKVLNPANLGIP